VNVIENLVTISIVIPVFNEEDNVHEILSNITMTLEKYPQYYCQILLINDGSTDNTSAEVVKYLEECFNIKYPIFFIENEKNIGTAQTMLKLFKLAVSKKPSMVIKLDMDHDFSHQEVLCKFFDTISTSGFCFKSTILVGIRVIPNEKVMTFYEQARKKRTDDFLKEKLGLKNYDPVSGGTQLYPLHILEEVLTYPVVKNYKLKWGVDVLLPLLARKNGYQLHTIPILNSRYCFDRRSDNKVKSQYDAFTTVFELVM
jgi:glycosyltransferase involved in cell wall biosynthesis